jgi:phage baseplate assembly protein V
MNAADFHRAIGPLRRRVGAMIGRATLSSIDDSPQAQELQVELLDGEAHDAVERFQEYGFTSVPLADAEAVVAFVGGLRSHGVVIAVEDRRYRLRSLSAGEVAMYDDLGQVVHLTRDGIRITTSKKIEIDAGEDVLIRSAGEVKVEAESALIDAGSVDLGGAGGPAVARVGDTVAGGVITSGSSKVRAG